MFCLLYLFLVEDLYFNTCNTLEVFKSESSTKNPACFFQPSHSFFMIQVKDKLVTEQ